MILLLNLAADMTLLALESQTIIGTRLARLSLGGPAAMVEAERMVSEKVLALGEAATTLVTGGSAHDVVRDTAGTCKRTPNVSPADVNGNAASPVPVFRFHREGLPWIGARLNSSLR
jgi:hypothetical protein